MAISSRILSAIWVSALYGLIPEGALAENRFSFDSPCVMAGTTGQSLHLLLDHDVTVSAYQIRLRYDPAVIRFQGVTAAGTDLENFEFLGGDFDSFLWIDPAEGILTFGLILDPGSDPAGGNFLVPNPSPQTPHRILRLMFDVPSPSATAALINFEAGFGAVVWIDNFIVDNIANKHFPLLTPGTIAVVAPGELSVDAGANRMAAENSTHFLQARVTPPLPPSHLRFQWTQTLGLPVGNLQGQLTGELRLTLPELQDDGAFEFQVTVSDCLQSAVDSVRVGGVDLDQRRVTLGAAETGPARVFAAGRQAILFNSSIAWDSPLEDGRWTGVRFRLPVSDPEWIQSINRLDLHLDRNQNGVIDAGDELLDSVSAGEWASTAAPLNFQFSKLLLSGEASHFLLSGEFSRALALKTPAADSWPPWALLAAFPGLGLWIILRRRLKGAADLPPRIFTLLLLSLCILTASPSCGGGGGSRSSGANAAPVPTQLQFTLDASTDLDVLGQQTGVRIPVSGAVQKGLTLEL